MRSRAVGTWFVLAASILVASVLVLVTNARSQPSDTPPGRATPATIIYGGDRAFRSFEWINGGGEPAGFQVDLIRAVAREAGVSVEVRLGVWADVLSEFAAGRVQVISLFESASRQTWAEFCEPHAVQYSQIFIRRGGQPAESLEDLAGRTVIVQHEALAEETLRARSIAVTFLEYLTETDVLAALSRGEGDAAITTQLGGRNAIEELGLANIVTAGPPVLSSHVAFAVEKGNTALRDTLSAGLARVHASGEYDEIYARWYGDVERPAIPVRRVLRWSGWIGLPILALGAAGWVYSRALRSRVRVRTRELADESETRSRAEAALRESEQRLRVALSGQRILVAHQDANLRYTWVYNADRIIGQPEVLGRTDEQLFEPESASRLTEIKREVLEKGRGAHAEVELRGLPGSILANGRTFELAVEPLREAGGTITGITSSLFDITELKEASAERLSMERRLAVAEKFESLGLLAGGVAHDFNNLLVGVTGNASLLQLELQPGTRAHGLADSVMQAARTAADLTGQLLTFTGRDRVSTSEVRLADLADDIARVMRPSLPAGVALELDVARPPPPIRADPTQIRQIILNLVQNAADALGGRPGTITLRTSRVDAHEGELIAAIVGSDIPPGPYATLEVLDTGSGIDRAHANRIFEPFYTTKSGGRGIGLAVVAGIVKRHHGAILVNSQPGRGTHFRVLFPIGPSTPEPGPGDARTATRAR